MDEFLSMIQQIDPEADLAEIKNFIDTVSAKYPYLGEEDLQQLVLMMGVSQGSLKPEDYTKIIMGRDTESKLPQFFQEIGYNAKGGNFGDLVQKVKGK